MTFKEACQPYREEATGMVVLVPQPRDHSCDNGLLFSSTYMMLLGEEATTSDVIWFTHLVETCSLEPGLLARYPTETWPSSWDDHVGVAVAAAHYNKTIAKDLWAYGKSHHFMYGSNFLARIVDFMPTLKCAAGEPLTWLEQALVATAFLANFWEDREQVSGRCLLYLKQRLFWGKYWLIDLAISLWRARMGKLYPQGMRQVYTMYFKDHHPFAQYGAKDYF